MRFGEIFYSAVRGLLANKLRSVLTTIGIMIGVAAVIVIVAVGEGASQRVMSSINSLGASTMTVYPRYDPSTNMAREMSLEDAEALSAPELSDRIKAVVPGVYSSGSINDGERTKDQAQVFGTHPDYFQLQNALLARGTYFSKSDVTESRKVLVLGSKLASELFAGRDPVNRQVVISGMQFVVVGVLEEAGQGGRGRGIDEMAVMPLSTLQNTLTGQQPISSLVVQAHSVAGMDAARAAIERTLRVKHRIDADKPSDFEISDPRDLTRSSREISMVFTYLILAIGGITLLIGGVGITNIMLVTVTERTREIGIRKAIGATRGAIMGQFLVEAMMLSMFGGILGVIVGLIGGQFSIRGFQLVVVPSSVVLAFGVSALIGLFFGWLPANRASKLHPIQALRHE
ncbi:putative ABC transport system permease protein [Crossiella equi]|uniref:ABC transport system permease protein n=1 Tax=Crossiella equi TaxID=130796 RepID=A0ABS5AII4_9PSEU|nr:ABC transporter permease [Crossiella equi]MBP2476019.1 putative ABC transport system permease protein [Crossiella equi]